MWSDGWYIRMNKTKDVGGSITVYITSKRIKNQFSMKNFIGLVPNIFDSAIIESFQ